MAPKTAKKSRNPDLIRGIGKYSRSATYHKRGLWAIKAKNGVVFPRHDKKSSTDEPPKFYPDDDVKKPLVNKRKPKPTKLRNVLLLYSLAGLTQSAFALGYEVSYVFRKPEVSDIVIFKAPPILQGGSFIHARGFSVHYVFRHITEHAAMALQYWTKDQGMNKY